MGHLLLAVLVPATATVDSIDAHLATPMRPLLREHSVDGYRLGGGVTGAWTPDYDPQADPANWRPCEPCAGTGRRAGRPCAACADAVEAGRPAGTVVAYHADWTPCPGDLVPLPKLHGPSVAVPAAAQPRRLGRPRRCGVARHQPHQIRARRGPRRGTPRLRLVFDHLLAGRRSPLGRQRTRGLFDPAAWSVAVVDAHH